MIKTHSFPFFILQSSPPLPSPRLPSPPLPFPPLSSALCVAGLSCLPIPFCVWTQWGGEEFDSAGSHQRLAGKHVPPPHKHTHTHVYTYKHTDVMCAGHNRCILHTVYVYILYITLEYIFILKMSTLCTCVYSCTDGFWSVQFE